MGRLHHHGASLKRLVLIDGDSLVYDAGKRVERIVQWSDDCWSWWADPKEGIALLETLIAQVIDGTNADAALIALSDYESVNFRNLVMPSYKNARQKKHHTSRPIIWSELRKYIQLTKTFAMWPSLEGDDVLGVLATDPTFAPNHEKIVASIDKDLFTIPGKLVNFHSEQSAFGFEVHEITQAAADRYHMMQTLTGDTTDGYPGCPGIGKVTAEKILSSFGLPEMTFESFGPGEHHKKIIPETFDVAGAWAAIVAQYAKKGLGESVALENARVARICRVTDINPETKEVILWNPPLQ